jgi:hypothetical protein
MLFVEIPVLYLPGAFAGPAFSNPVAVAAFARSLAVRTIDFVGGLLDVGVGIVTGGALSLTRAVTIRAFPACIAVRAASGIGRTEGTFFGIIPCTAFLHTGTRSDTKSSDSSNKSSSSHRTGSLEGFGRLNAEKKPVT